MIALQEKLYIAEWSESTVLTLDTTTHTVTKLKALAIFPVKLIAAAICKEQLYVAQLDDIRIGVINANTSPPTYNTNVVTSSLPRALAVANDRVFVANYLTHSVTVIDTSTNEIEAQIPTGRRPRALAVIGNNLYVANEYDGSITVIDLATNGTSTIDDVGTRPTALATIGQTLVVACQNESRVRYYDTPSGTTTQDVPLAGPASSLAVVGQSIYATMPGQNQAVAIDPSYQVTTIAVGNYPIAVAEANGNIYVANKNDNTVSVIDVATNQVSHTVSLAI